MEALPRSTMSAVTSPEAFCGHLASARRSRNEERARQGNPSAYPGLVVRVAGYCAYFIDFQPAVQD